MVPFWERVPKYVTAGIGADGGPSAGVVTAGMADAYDTCKHNR